MDIRRLEDLKDKLMRELDSASAKSPLTIADIQMIDTLSHSIKNICKIMENDGYSGGDWRAEGSYRDGYSGARHYVRGHYSHAPYEERSYRDMLENEYTNARDDRERETIRRMLDRM